MTAYLLPYRLTPEREKTDESLHAERDLNDRVLANDDLAAFQRRLTEISLLQERQHADEEITNLRRLLAEERSAHFCQTQQSGKAPSTAVNHLKTSAYFISLAAQLLLEDPHSENGIADAELIQHIHHSAQKMLQTLGEFFEPTDRRMPPLS
jgi:hypothetical protein